MAGWSILGVCLVLTACSKKDEPEAEPVVPVQVAEVQRSQIERRVDAEGILYPLTQSAVMPKISAPVREFYVNRGDHVRKGQLLAVLENQDLTAATVENRGLFKQAEATYRSTTAASLPEEIEKTKLETQSAKQALDAAEKLYESRKELLAEGAIARRLVDEANVAYVQAKSQYEVSTKHLEALLRVLQQAETSGAEGQLEAAKGRYEGAEAQLKYSQITSPISGVVTDRSVYAGEAASTNTPLLTIMDVSRVIAHVSVPTQELTKLKVGDSATITDPDGQSYAGKVTVVSPAVDPNSTTAEVWVTADNPKEHLRPGETVRVSILVERIKDATVVPSAALVPSQDGSITVMVLSPDSVAHERKVKIGVRSADKVQILEGVNPGEKIIVVGALGLQDKARVRIDATNQHE